MIICLIINCVPLSVKRSSKPILDITDVIKIAATIPELPFVKPCFLNDSETSSNLSVKKKSKEEQDYSICMQVMNFWTHINAELGGLISSLLYSLTLASERGKNTRR